MMPIIALVSAAKITVAQTTHSSQTQPTINSQNADNRSPYQVGTITGVVSGPYGSIIFIELANKTKLKFHHPSNSINRGEQVLIYKKNDNYFLIESTDP